MGEGGWWPGTSLRPPLQEEVFHPMLTMLLARCGCGGHNPGSPRAVPTEKHSQRVPVLTNPKTKKEARKGEMVRGSSRGSRGRPGREEAEPEEGRTRKVEKGRGHVLKSRLNTGSRGWFCHQRLVLPSASGLRGLPNAPAPLQAGYNPHQVDPRGPQLPPAPTSPSPQPARKLHQPLSP